DRTHRRTGEEVRPAAVDAELREGDAARGREEQAEELSGRVREVEQGGAGARSLERHVARDVWKRTASLEGVVVGAGGEGEGGGGQMDDRRVRARVRLLDRGGERARVGGGGADAVARNGVAGRPGVVDDQVDRTERRRRRLAVVLERAD